MTQLSSWICMEAEKEDDDGERERKRERDLRVDEKSQ
jgi:hypothetical protein